MRSLSEYSIDQWLLVVIAAIVVAAGLSGSSGKDLIELIETLLGIYAGLLVPLKTFQKSKSDKAREAASGDIYMNPFLISLLVLFTLQLGARIVAALASAAIAVWLGYVSSTPLDVLEENIILAEPLVTNLVAAVLIYPIARFATYRIRRRAWLWILVALLLSQVIDVLNVWLVQGETYTAQEILLESAKIAILLPGALLGIWNASTTRLDYRMALLFKLQSAENKATLIDLAAEAYERELKEKARNEEEAAGSPEESQAEER